MKSEVAEEVYDLLDRRRHSSALILTSNRKVEEWGSVFADPVLAGAAIDRLFDRATIVTFLGDSYRLKGKTKLREGPKIQIPTEVNTLHIDAIMLLIPSLWDRGDFIYVGRNTMAQAFKYTGRLDLRRLKELCTLRWWLEGLVRSGRGGSLIATHLLP